MGTTIYSIMVAILFTHTAPKLSGPCLETQHLGPPWLNPNSGTTHQPLQQNQPSPANLPLDHDPHSASWDIVTHWNVETLLVWAWLT